MKIEELNKLSEPQQRNALLAIALGYKIDYTKRCSGSDEWAFGVHPTHTANSFWLHQWAPAGDGTLMWQLAKELADFNASFEMYSCKRHKYVAYSESEQQAATYEQALITSYILCDPKGLITKWRKENE